jgi:hypothetical protein
VSRGAVPGDMGLGPGLAALLAVFVGYVGDRSPIYAQALNLFLTVAGKYDCKQAGLSTVDADVMPLRGNIDASTTAMLSGLNHVRAQQHEALLFPYDAYCGAVSHGCLAKVGLAIIGGRGTPRDLALLRRRTVGLALALP